MMRMSPEPALADFYLHVGLPGLLPQCDLFYVEGHQVLQGRHFRFGGRDRVGRRGNVGRVRAAPEFVQRV